MPRIATITGPAHWANYLVDGDTSDLSLLELAQSDAWRKRAGFRDVLGIASDNDEPHFTWSMRLYAPELDCEGGDVTDYIVQYDD